MGVGCGLLERELRGGTVRRERVDLGGLFSSRVAGRLVESTVRGCAFRESQQELDRDRGSSNGFRVARTLD